MDDQEPRRLEEGEAESAPTAESASRPGQETLALRKKREFAARAALLAAEENRELVTVATAARLLGKSRDTLYRWLVEGRIEGRRVGGRWLVYRDAVDRHWADGRVAPKGA
jgi:excisionase family DNA binding protein